MNNNNLRNSSITHEVLTMNQGVAILLAINILIPFVYMLNKLFAHVPRKNLKIAAITSIFATVCGIGMAGIIGVIPPEIALLFLGLAVQFPCTSAWIQIGMVLHHHKNANNIDINLELSHHGAQEDISVDHESAPTRTNPTGEILLLLQSRSLRSTPITDSAEQKKPANEETSKRSASFDLSMA